GDLGLHHEDGAVDDVGEADGALQEPPRDQVGQVPGEDVRARAGGEGPSPVHVERVRLDDGQPVPPIAQLGGEDGDEVAVALDGDDAGGPFEEGPGQGPQAGADLQDGAAARG